MSQSGPTEYALGFTVADDAELQSLAADLTRFGSLGTVLSLADGSVVSNYLALDVVMSRPRLLRRAAMAFMPYLDPAIERIAASSVLGIALATAISLELYIPMTIVGPRPDFRVRGTGRPGERVALIEDQVLTGASARARATALGDAGVNVTQIVALLHRSERPAPQLADFPASYTALLAPALQS